MSEYRFSRQDGVLPRRTLDFQGLDEFDLLMEIPNKLHGKKVNAPDGRSLGEVDQHNSLLLSYMRDNKLLLVDIIDGIGVFEICEDAHGAESGSPDDEDPSVEDKKLISQEKLNRRLRRGAEAREKRRNPLYGARKTFLDALKQRQFEPKEHEMDVTGDPDGVLTITITLPKTGERKSIQAKKWEMTGKIDDIVAVLLTKDLPFTS